MINSYGSFWRIVAALLIGLSALTVASSQPTTIAANEQSRLPLELDLNLQNGSFWVFKGDQYLLNRDNDESLRISLIIDNEIHVLNDSHIFDLQINTNFSIPSVIWQSSQYLVHLLFFELEENAMQISIVLYNRNNQEGAVGLRLLFDTILDEQEGGGIYVADMIYNQEQFIRGANLVSAIRSQNVPNNKLSSFSGKELVFALQGENITPPDRILVANYQRLNRNPWYFRIKEGRDFTYPPYIGRNSGIALYFEPIIIPSGERHVYQIVLGDDSQRTYQALPFIIALQALFGKNYDILLRLLNNIESGIDYIDALNQEEQEVENNDIERLTDTLEETREDLRAYDQQE